MRAFTNEEIYILYKMEDEPALKEILFQLNDGEINELIESCEDEKAKDYFRQYLKIRQDLIQII